MTKDDECLSMGLEGFNLTRRPLSTGEISNNIATPVGGRLGGKIPSTDAPQVTESHEEKRMRRKMANRRSAKESRARRRHLLSKLQVAVDSLSAENKAMKKLNTQLHREIHELQQQLVIANSIVDRGAQNQSTASAFTPYQHDLSSTGNNASPSWHG